MERQQDNIGWRKQCSVFPPLPPPSPTTVSPVLVSCISPCCIQALYPKEFQCPMSGAEFQWFSPPLNLNKFLRELDLCALCPSPHLVQEVSDWKSTHPPSQIFDQYSGWWSTFKWLNVYIARIGQLFWQHCCCNVFPKYLQGWISGQWGSVSTLAPIVVTRR